jgi:hypothetical protein
MLPAAESKPSTLNLKQSKTTAPPGGHKGIDMKQNLQGAIVFDCRIKNIPCQIAYWDRERYSVLDRKGYDAPWLEARVESWKIEELIEENRYDRKELCDE